DLGAEPYPDPEFLPQLPVHRLLGRLIGFDLPAGELPPAGQRLRRAAACRQETGGAPKIVHDRARGNQNGGGGHAHRVSGRLIGTVPKVFHRLCAQGCVGRMFSQAWLWTELWSRWGRSSFFAGETGAEPHGW